MVPPLIDAFGNSLMSCISVMISTRINLGVRFKLLRMRPDHISTA